MVTLELSELVGRYPYIPVVPDIVISIGPYYN